MLLSVSILCLWMFDSVFFFDLAFKFSSVSRVWSSVLQLAFRCFVYGSLLFDLYVSYMDCQFCALNVSCVVSLSPLSSQPPIYPRSSSASLAFLSVPPI